MMDDTKNLKEVHSTVSQVEGMVREMAVRDEKRLKWAVGVKAALLVFVVVYMGWAYSNFRLVDADLFVITAQHKFYEALPDAKVQMAKHLERIAPSIIDQAGEGVLKAIPRLENQIETSSQRILLELSGPLEKDFSAWLSSFIYETREILDEMFPGMSSYEKITLLRQYVLEDFRDVLQGIGDEIGDSLEGHSFKQQLRRLADGKNLTEKERLQRDIIAVWSVLIRNKLTQVDLEELDSLESILRMNVLETGRSSR